TKHDNRYENLILPRLQVIEGKKTINNAIIEECQSPYLTKRGISEKAQLEAGVGKSRHYGFVAIPWYDVNGELANVKYRATKGKAFFYERGGRPIREL